MGVAICHKTHLSRRTLKRRINMNKDEKSLLLYFETCVVDQSGRVNTLKMNKIDCDIAEKWDKEGFISYGRICFKDCIASRTKKLTHFVQLSDKAINMAHQIRKERAARMWKNKSYETTKES